MTGLKMGLQFAELASEYAEEGNWVAARRNLRQGREVYEEFLKFLAKATLTPSQRQQVETDLPRLKKTLEALEIRLKDSATS